MAKGRKKQTQTKNSNIENLYEILNDVQNAVKGQVEDTQPQDEPQDDVVESVENDNEKSQVEDTESKDESNDVTVESEPFQTIVGTGVDIKYGENVNLKTITIGSTNSTNNPRITMTYVDGSDVELSEHVKIVTENDVNKKDKVLKLLKNFEKEITFQNLVKKSQIQTLFYAIRNLL